MGNIVILVVDGTYQGTVGNKMKMDHNSINPSMHRCAIEGS